MFDSPLTILTIVFVLFILIFPIALRGKYSANELGSFAAIIGILGTFVGVTLGLFSFEESDIQGSIPNLLDGLKTAFITSIAGMTVSLCLRMWPRVYGMKKDAEETKGATIETLATLLKSIRDNQVESNNALVKSLTGDGDSTIVTQIQKMRMTTSDKLDVLNSSFNSFAEKMVANNTQALVDALTDVMKDFNNKINEQFGDNFKELNNAVKLMVEWQNNYKDQVDQSIQQLISTSRSISDTEKSIGIISNYSSTLVAASQGMESALGNIFIGLSSLNEVGENAKTTLPRINENLELLTTTFTERIKSSIDEIQKQGTSLTETQNKINEITLTRIDNVNASIEKQFKELDEALSQELTKALEALGNQLASVSNKFVQDYIPLTNKLKEVISIAEQLDSKN